MTWLWKPVWVLHQRMLSNLFIFESFFNSLSYLLQDYNWILLIRGTKNWDTYNAFHGVIAELLHCFRIQSNVFHLEYTNWARFWFRKDLEMMFVTAPIKVISLLHQLIGRNGRHWQSWDNVYRRSATWTATSTINTSHSPCPFTILYLSGTQWKIG